MIGKVIIGKSFRGCISYCLEKKDSKLLITNNCFGNKSELIQQFNEVRQLNTKVLKPVWHACISFSKQDNVDDNLMLKVAQEYSKEFELDDHQYIVVKHSDKEHAHFHLIANRINPFAGKTLSDSNNYKKTAEFSRKMEKLFSLEQVESPNRFIQKNLVRHDSRKESIKYKVVMALMQSSNFSEFSGKLIVENIVVEKGRGIAFIDDAKVRVKGSSIGLSLQTIYDKFDGKLDPRIEKILITSIHTGNERGNIGITS
jgi:hypothetical protein